MPGLSFPFVYECGECGAVEVVREVDTPPSPNDSAIAHAFEPMRLSWTRTSGLRHGPGRSAATALTPRTNNASAMPEKPPLRDTPEMRRCTACDEDRTVQHHVDWEPHKASGERFLREVWECSECGSQYLDGRDRKPEP